MRAMRLRPLTCLCPSKPGMPPRSGGLDRLTVQDDHRRAGQAAAAQARLLMKRPACSLGLPSRYGAIQGPGGVVEIGVVASGAHGSRNRADEPCFARGGSTSRTPSNFVTKREDAAAASKSFLRTCAPAAGVDDVLSTVVPRWWCVARRPTGLGGCAAKEAEGFRLGRFLRALIAQRSCEV